MDFINAVGHAVGHAISDAMHGSIHHSNRIWVQTNAPSYVGGDTITGTVEMDCLVPFFAKGVHLRVKGFERSWWQEKRTEFEGEGQNRKSVVKIHEHRENKEFFKQTIVVYPHQGTVNTGHYSFPFVYTLPPTLPGTFFEEGGNHHHGDGYYAKILYKLKAAVDVAHRHDLKQTIRLVVNERYGSTVQPSYAENRKSFLTAPGDLHARVWLDKNAYVPGETCIAKLKANNTSTKSTTLVRIKVHHHLELHAHGHTKHISHTVYTQEFPGFLPCFYGIRWMPFFIPVGLKPSSTSGHHVRSHYVFDVECAIPGAVNLHVNLPVALLAPQFLYSTVPPQPANMPLPPNVNYRPEWQADDSAAVCSNDSCKKGFSLFSRRHHCRHCARVYCDNCTKKRSAIPKLKFNAPVRVCDACHPHAVSGGIKLQSAKAVMTAYHQMLQSVVPGSPPMSGMPSYPDGASSTSSPSLGPSAPPVY
eukprot:TRINITY_DN10779_c0_g1_i1.p1 TRINITY_DN10779_c0_g1~~TRINITY_DN10779_c0_g1_i1.p1  ORF type:complete len:474 (+),score=104.69 TRINITY_DN10779_c0_g1_i1:194-1615(+)